MQKTLTPTLAAYASGKSIAPLWVAPNGRAFYPIAGGAEDPPKLDDGKPAGGDDGGDKFKPIASQEELDRIIGTRLSREREKYADYEELKTAKAEYDKILEASKTEQEKAVDAARSEGEKAALERANTRVVLAEAKALAAELGAHNSAVAVGALNLTDVKVAEDGSIDTAAIKSKIDALKASDPYLFGDGRARPKPDPSQGGGGDDDKPSVARGAEIWEKHRGKKTS